VGRNSFVTALRFTAREPSAEWKNFFDSLTQDLRPGLQIFRPCGAWSLPDLNLAVAESESSATPR
ncbi:MAG TPA: hypothetical protein VK657_07460, partial [Terriglobales bacterium]|nr:hypothetical protein [Terriglobales bacterium]